MRANTVPRPSAAGQLRAPQQPISSQGGERQPGGTHEKDHVGVLKGHIAAKSEGNSGQGGGTRAGPPAPGEVVTAGGGQDDVAHDVELETDREVERQEEHELAGIKNAGGGIGEDGSAIVFQRVPERDAAGSPLAAAPLEQRVVEMARIADGGNLVTHQQGAKKDQQGDGDCGNRPRDGLTYAERQFFLGAHV